MTYDVIALACEKLSYRDKLRLAQLLIQAARKEEENANPQNRSESEVTTKNSKIAKTQATDKVDTIGYVVERLLKLRPSKKKTLVNSIKSMFQFQGGISDVDIDIVSVIYNRIQLGHWGKLSLPLSSSIPHIINGENPWNSQQF